MRTNRTSICAQGHRSHPIRSGCRNVGLRSVETRTPLSFERGHQSRGRPTEIGKRSVRIPPRPPPSVEHRGINTTEFPGSPVSGSGSGDTRSTRLLWGTCPAVLQVHDRSAAQRHGPHTTSTLSDQTNYHATGEPSSDLGSVILSGHLQCALNL